MDNKQSINIGDIAVALGVSKTTVSRAISGKGRISAQTRARVKSAVKNMAKELTALYAKRMSIKGYAFAPDS